MDLTRRNFLTYAGLGSLAALAGRADTVRALAPDRKGPPPAFFQPIDHSSADRLILPDGFRADRVITYDDPLGSTGPAGAEKFGFNCDFNCYCPIDALTGGRNSAEGLLWTNHEYPNPLFVSGFTGGKKVKKTAGQIRAEKLSVGGSVVHVRREGGTWKPVVGSKFNRRVTASYPEIPLTGPAAKRVPAGVGSLANCSGGRTPWFTVLSCEENYPDFNAGGKEGLRWADVASEALDERQYGWVVEVDPFGELPPRKHSSLGRFKHENASLRVGPKGKLVVYMGDDEADEHLYKFVSAEAVPANGSRADKRAVLERGTLYAADFPNGRWLPLDRDRSPKLRDLFATQADVLMETRKAAKALGATPLDRCEDCEVFPADGSIYVAMTNNNKKGNAFGKIVRVIEASDDPEGEAFRFEVFLAGGAESGLACPDNLAFDRHGNLWVVCDVGSDKLNAGVYKPFGNNGLYVVPTAGSSAGDAFQFASGPVEAELTGPWFTEDESTLFLSVQHPGEMSESLTKLTSHWPEGGSAVPKPAVVAVTGFRW